MNALTRVFKRIVSQVAAQAGTTPSRLMKDHDLERFLLDIEAKGYSVREVAAHALFQFCVTGGRFNRFVYGVQIAVAFLDEQMEDPPQDKAQCLHDLKSILDQGGPFQAIEKWVVSHYR
jgi:hypothetical protein